MQAMSARKPTGGHQPPTTFGRAGAVCGVAPDWAVGVVAVCAQAAQDRKNLFDLGALPAGCWCLFVRAH